MKILTVEVEKFSTNGFIVVAGLLAIILPLIADYLNGYYGNTPYMITVLIIGLFFILGFREEKELQKTYSSQNIPIPIVFNISNSADTKSALNSLFEKLEEKFPNHKKNLKKYLNIVEDDLIFSYNGDIYDQERFIDFLKVTKHDIKQLEKRTPKNVKYHIAYVGPISTAIMIGTIFGTEGLTIYQYNKSSDAYTMSIDINSRDFKEHIKELQVSKKEILGDIDSSESITVALDYASHSLALESLDKPIIHLKSTLGATIKKPEDFIRANLDIYSVLNELQQSGKHIKLIYSMPTSMGIVLGMSIQNYWDVELTQYDSGEYKTVIEHLNSIKYYF